MEELSNTTSINSKNFIFILFIIKPESPPVHPTMSKRFSPRLAHSHGNDPNDVVSDETLRNNKEVRKAEAQEHQNRMRELAKDQDALFTFAAKRFAALIFVVLVVIVNDAFLLKYGASFTISGTFLLMIEYARYYVQQAGFYIAKLANFAQLIWDLADMIIEQIKEYLPLEQLAQSRALMNNAVRSLFEFMSVGWFASLVKGFAEGLRISPYLPLSFAVILAVLMWWDDVKRFVAKMSVDGNAQK